MRLFCLILCLCATLPAFSQSDARALRITTAWEAWVTDYSINQSALTISCNGKIVSNHGLTNHAKPIASLSKAITAICIDHLVKSNMLSYTDTLAEIFGMTDPDMMPDNQKVSLITLGQLVTHTSGLGPDSTQRSMLRWINKKRPRHGRATENALNRANQDGVQGQHLYNNENYAVLGTIIEFTTEEEYGPYCQRTVLAPIGVTTATLEQKGGSFSSFGGWSISTNDYSRFIAAHFGPKSKVGEDPFSTPSARAQGDVYYGLGTYFRTGKTENNFWHFGAICIEGANSGSYFAYWRGEWAVTVTYDACVNWNAMRELDRALAIAALKS